MGTITSASISKKSSQGISLHVYQVGAFFIKCTIDLVCRYTIGILYYFPSCLFFLHRVNPITWTGQELLLVPCEQGSMESVAQLYKSNDDEEEEEEESSAL